MQGCSSGWTLRLLCGFPERFEIQRQERFRLRHRREIPHVFIEKFTEGVGVFDTDLEQDVELPGYRGYVFNFWNLDAASSKSV